MTESILNEAIGTLISLGLNSSQARIYLAVAQRRICTARHVSRLSGVNRQEIYRIMPDLEALGLIEKLIGVPTKWRAVPLRDGLSILLQRKDNEIYKLHYNAKKLVDDFGKNNFINNNRRTEQPLADSQFILIPKSEAAIRWVQNKIENSHLSVDLLLQANHFLEVMYYEGERLKKVMNNGVKARGIFYGSEKDIIALTAGEAFKYVPHFPIRYISDTSLGSIIIFDNVEVLMSTIHASIGRPQDAANLYSINPVFIEIAKKYYEFTWNTAIPYTRI